MSESPGANPWEKVIGPCYTAEALQRELGMTPTELTAAVRELQVLRLRTSDGVDLYPAFQTQAGHVLPGLGAVLQELAKGFQAPWMWAQWLNAPIARPGGATRRHIEELAAGNVAAIAQEARNTAAAWSS